MFAPTLEGKTPDASDAQCAAYEALSDRFCAMVDEAVEAFKEESNSIDDSFVRINKPKTKLTTTSGSATLIGRLKEVEAKVSWLQGQ